MRYNHNDTLLKPPVNIYDYCNWLTTLQFRDRKIEKKKLFINDGSKPLNAIIKREFSFTGAKIYYMYNSLKSWKTIITLSLLFVCGKRHIWQHGIMWGNPHHGQTVHHHEWCCNFRKFNCWTVMQTLFSNLQFASTQVFSQ